MNCILSSNVKSGVKFKKYNCCVIHNQFHNNEIKTHESRRTSEVSNVFFNMLFQTSKILKLNKYGRVDHLVLIQLTVHVVISTDISNLGLCDLVFMYDT